MKADPPPAALDGPREPEPRPPVVGEESKLLGSSSSTKNPMGGARGVRASAMKRGSWLDEKDDLAKACFACGVEFGTFVDSRHHCRRCGNTFCAKCSGKRAPLLLFEVTDPARLCDACYPEAVADNEFAARHLPRLTRGTAGACRAGGVLALGGPEAVLVRLNTAGDAVLVLGKDATPLRTVPLADVTAVDEPNGGGPALVIRERTEGPFSSGLKIECGTAHEREGLADALRAAARRSRAPDLASDVERGRAKAKLERRRQTSIRDRLATAEERRKSNSKLRDSLRDKYSLGAR